MDGRLSGKKKLPMKSHANGGHASARRLGRVLVGSDRGNMHLLTCVDGILGHREVCRSFEKAPHVPAPATSTVSMFNEKF